MKIKKLAAIALATVAAGALGAFATNAQLSGYVSTSDGTLTSPMIVIGSEAGDAINYPKDVVAAADLAAHVAGYATTPVTVAGAAKSFSITGEGKEIATSNTKVYLDDSLGKSGLRSTMTDADLPILLASGSVVDNASVTIKYDQFLFLKPNSTTNERWILQFDRPSSSSADDGTYTIGRFQTSPYASNAGYFLNYRLNFKKDTSFPNLIGKTLTIAGETYTVLAGSDSAAATPELQATKAAASQTVLVSDGVVSITVGDTTYEVQIIGTSDSTTVVISVNGVSKSAAKGATTNIGGVDVYVDDVFHFANNQDSSGGTLLIGAEKIIFRHNSKIKTGTEEDNIDGTYVRFTTSGGKATSMDIYLGAPASSVTDNLRMGNSYTLPALSKLALHFPGISEDLTADSRNVLKVLPSGINDLQLEWTDDSGNTATITWAHKATAAGTTLSLQDTSANNIEVLENTAIAQDEYLVLDAGDFPHLMQMTSISTDSLSFTLLDVFSGDSVKYDLSSTDVGAKTIYIDGQAYQAVFDGVANTTINFTWGDGATGSNANPGIGDARTLWPTLKGWNGERLAFLSTNVTLNATGGSEIQLPTGAVSITVTGDTGNKELDLTATTDEDGEASACTTSPCVTNFNLSVTGVINFTLGKTATGGLNYELFDNGANGLEFIINVRGEGSSTAGITQPSLLLFEEKDDASDRYSVILQSSVDTSTTDKKAEAASPVFTADEDSRTKGSDTTITDYVDLYGTFVTLTTSGQDALTLYYPDDQVHAIIGAGAADATASIGGAAGTTVNAAVVITSPIAKLANEVNTATLASDLILVGGPCANALVAELAADDTTGIPACDAWTLTTGLIKEVENAFGSGRKALVVAGTTADDTRSLAAQVLQGTLSFEV